MQTPYDNLKTLILGGGCFWCIEAVLSRVTGVRSLESGYANGQVANPTYEAVCQGDTGHTEVVRVVYDPAQLSLAQLLEVFFAVHDPTTLNRQGHDVGTQYRSAIYWADPQDEAPVRAWVLAQQAQPSYANRPIVTELAPLTMYYAAEGYHQRYFEQQPHAGYCAFVVRPKIDKLLQNFAPLARPVPPEPSA
ncbi:MAG: peptide-methionine (S)-S-oxide reductase MsrA [Burkholderiaceae bacterium]